MSGKKAANKNILSRLAAGQIVVLTPTQWEKAAGMFSLKETINTGLAGDILLMKRSLPGKNKQAWALLEEPKPDEKVIRPLDTEREARALIADRLAAYERMWDG